MVGWRYSVTTSVTAATVKATKKMGSTSAAQRSVKYAIARGR